MLDKRSAGILLHPTSLPAHGGIGDLGPAAYEFIDFLAAARQGLWQILPLNPVGIGNSPYSSTSAFAGNILLVSLERLADRGMISQRAGSLRSTHAEGRVDYARVMREKLPLLQEAAAWFLRHADGETRARFDRFVAENSWWLEDYVLFEALRAPSRAAELEHLAARSLPIASRRPWRRSAKSCATSSTAPAFSSSPSLSSGARCTPTAAARA